MTLILVYNVFSYDVLSQFVTVNVVHPDLQLGFSDFGRLMTVTAKKTRSLHSVNLDLIVCRNSFQKTQSNYITLSFYIISIKGSFYMRHLPDINSKIIYNHFLEILFSLLQNLKRNKSWAKCNRKNNCSEKLKRMLYDISIDQAKAHLWYEVRF